MSINIFPEFETDYLSYTELGKKAAKDLTLCVTGILRNVEKNLSSKLDHISEFDNLFKNVTYFFYENDSTDNTKNILSRWAVSGNNRNIICEKIGANHPCGPSSKSTERTTALASYRNKCKNWIKENTDTDLVCVIDLDFLSLHIDGLLNSIGWMQNLDIDAMAGFSYLLDKTTKRLTNYDSWAYRHTWWSDHQQYLGWFLWWHPFVGSKPFKVNSAFGGSTIYKRKYYIDADYDGYDCEHVCFHKNIYTKHNKFNLYVNPTQLMVM